MDEQDKTALEMLMDKYSLKTVLEAISEICHEKAEHVQSAWQDDKLSAAWAAAGQFMDVAANRRAVERVS